jgi:hypothetical protein
MSDWSNSETGQNVKVVKSRWRWSNPLSAYSGLSEFSQNYKVVKLVIVVKCQTGQISNWSKSETGQKSEWSNPLGGHSGLGEFSQNSKLVKLVKVVKVVKCQTGQMSDWSKSETGQNLKLVKCQSGQIHSAVIRDLVSFLRIPKWSMWSKWS